MQSNKKKQYKFDKNPYTFEVKTVKLSDCEPDDIRRVTAENVRNNVNLAETRKKVAMKVMANSQRVICTPDYLMASGKKG